MRNEHGLGQKESDEGSSFTLRLTLDELIPTDTHLSAGVAVAEACASGNFPRFRGIEELDTKHLLDLHSRVRNAILSLGRKKHAQLEINKNQLDAYGRSIPIVAIAGDYLTSIGRGQSAISDPESRRIAVEEYKTFNDAFVKAGGKCNLRLINELDGWVSSANRG